MSNEMVAENLQKAVAAKNDNTYKPLAKKSLDEAVELSKNNSTIAQNNLQEAVAKKNGVNNNSATPTASSSSTSGGSWNFTADSEIQAELATRLNEAAEKFDTRVTEMYQQIDSMGANKNWVGEDYDAFKTGTEGYKQALSDLDNTLRMYSEQYKKMSEATEELSTELINIVNTSTTRHSK